MARKIIPIVALFLSSALVVALFVLPAVAQGEGFSETFDDPALPGWEHSPEVIIINGVLLIAPGNFAARMGAWGDFDLSFDLRFDAPGESEIQYHATDTGGYLVVLTMDRIMLLRAEPGSEPRELASTILETATSGDWMSLHITQSGGSHTIAVNEQVLLTSEETDPIQQGGLVFTSHGERTTQVDNITLTTTPVEGGEGVAPPPVEAAPTSTPALPAGTDTSWQNLIQSLSSGGGSTIDLGTFAINLLLAVAASFILSRVYVHWGASLSNRRKFAANFMLVTVTTTFIILVVRSSVALSLGLVGALSIIRFRAAIKEPEELAYLFFAISLGIGLGDNQRLVTLLSMVVVVIVLGLARLLRRSQSDVNMNLTISSGKGKKISMQQLMETLQKHCAKLRLMRYDETAEALEMSFVIEFRHTSDLDQARSALLALSEGLEISFMDNKGVW